MLEKYRACNKAGSELVSWDNIFNVHIECRNKLDRRRDVKLCPGCGAIPEHMFECLFCDSCAFSSSYLGFENCHQD